jgi:hypothetical protein
MIPVKLYIALFLILGVGAILTSAVGGQGAGVLLGLFFVAWGAIVWFLRYGRQRLNGGTSQVQQQKQAMLGSPNSSSIRVGKAHSAVIKTPLDYDLESRAFANSLISGSGKTNVALELLREDKTYDQTKRLVAAVPGLADDLFRYSGEQAVLLNYDPPWYQLCIFDFVLTGVFHRAWKFCSDSTLASLFTDAILFHATSEEPTAPDYIDVRSGLTHLYRGLAKYIVARTTIELPDADTPSWIFGLESAMARGEPLKLEHVNGLRRLAALFRQEGFSKTSTALCGKLVVNSASEVKPTSYPGAEYVIRPCMRTPSKLSEQTAEYKSFLHAAETQKEPQSVRHLQIGSGYGQTG